jgi:hypothetical protein
MGTAGLIDSVNNLPTKFGCSSDYIKAQYVLRALARRLHYFDRFNKQRPIDDAEVYTQAVDAIRLLADYRDDALVTIARAVLAEIANVEKAIGSKPVLAVS